MEDKNITQETNLIKRYLLEHPEANGDSKVIASLIEKEAGENAESIIVGLSERETPAIVTEELDEDVDLTKVDDRSDLEKIIAAGISIAKEKKQLPEELKEKLKTPEEIAANAFDSTTVIEAIEKTTNGYFSNIEEMTNYLVDMATVKAIAITEALVDQGVEFAKAAIGATATMLGGEAVGTFTDYVLDYVAPVVEVNIKVGVACLVRKCSETIKTMGKAVIGFMKKNVTEKIKNRTLQFQ